MNLTGLTEEEATKKLAKRREDLKTLPLSKSLKNHQNPKKSKATSNKTSTIILKNTLTLFNLVNLVLAVMILLVGSYKNLLFIIIAIANTLISIINELRAKKIVDKLKLLSEQKPTVIRDGKPRPINPEELVEGDLIVLSLGDQIPADATLEQGTIEVNESLLTGEQDNIAKHEGDQLISGSFIVSGTCKATVTKTPDESFITKLEQTAHTIKPADSKLFTIMNNIVKTISLILIPIGVLLLLARFRVPDTTPEVAVTTTVAALINMIPEGLVLLTSSVLALATIRLSKQKVLVQDLYSVETLARVDCICLDKTGTLTTGNMTVKDFIPAENQPKTALLNALELILAHSEADNATSTALKKSLPKSPEKALKTPILETIPFSSDRKYSGVKTKTAEYLMGALEFLTDNEDFLAQEKNLPENPQGNYRVISILKRELATKSPSPNSHHNTNPEPKQALTNKSATDTAPTETLLGFALLEDELRKDAKNIIKFFEDNDVEIKVISGDNLKTVQSIAEAVKVPNPTPIDLSALETPIDYEKLVKTYNIFTRVTPNQKKSIINALKKQGKTVAMTGDGVNDILAMKEADCSIAIGEGSDAARRSAKIVLLNSDFATVPKIIAEGRQSINNLERSATLFLTKTIYAAILAVIFALAPLKYPFSPISMTLLNILCIGLPGLALALEKNIARIKNQFVSNIKKFSIPTALAISISIVALSILAQVYHFSLPLLLTSSVIAVFALNYLLLIRISRPLTKLRLALLVAIFIAFLAALLLPFSATFFDFFHFF